MHLRKASTQASLHGPAKVGPKFQLIWAKVSIFANFTVCPSLTASLPPDFPMGSRFLAPLAVGQQAYVMARCPSCVRASVRALTFSLNIFFAETTYRILMKFHRNVPTMVLFRIS